jgi:hypothetical protein
MPGNQRLNWATTAQIGLVAAIVLAAVGYALLGPPATQQTAEAATLSPESAAVYQTKDHLLVTINVSNPDGKSVQGLLQVELLDPEGKVVARAVERVQQAEIVAGYGFKLSLPQLPADKLKLRYGFDKQEKFEAPLTEVLLAKAHETSLASSQELYAGSVAAIRCGVHGFRSYTESVPLAGAEVEIQLKAADGKVIPLHRGKTASNGIAQAEFPVPAVPPGKYTLQVATRSPLGEEKLEREVQVKAEPRVMLVTDKPLYQPGQTMHLRALSLRPIDLTPIGGQDLVFEVEDAKGNKVFKRTIKTSDFGIAAVDFQLADEVNMGDYQVRAILGQQQAQKTVAVKRYVLPKFKAELTTDKRYYMPQETIKADLQTDYFFGKPVAGGKVKVTASTFDVQFRQFATWEGQTDPNGHAKFEIKLPDYFVGQPLQKGDALVKLEVKVTDTADHSETITRTCNVSDQSIRVSLIPEGGRLVPDMENRVFVAAIYPDGSPAKCDVQLWRGREAKDKPLARLKTSDAGLAEFRLTPKADQFRQVGGEQRTIEMLGGQTVQGWGPKLVLDLFVQAKDGKGTPAQAVAEVNADPFGENVILRLDKAIYKGGDRVQAEVRTSTGMPTVYLDFIRGGQVLLTRWLDVKDGKAEHLLDLPANVFGTLEVHAYQMLSSGEIVRDSRVVYVHPREDLKIDVQADQKQYRPGESGKITFQVTDSQGKPTAAALGVIIVDEAVYALQEMQPGLEKVYFTLQEELLKPQAQVVYRPRESIDVLVREPVLAEPQQQIAQVLLTAVRPKPPARWEVAPAFERRQRIAGQVQAIGQALYQYVLDDSRSFMEYDGKAQRWVFKPNLLREVVKATGLDPAILNDPFGKKLELEGLSKLEKDFTVDRLAQAVTYRRMQVLYSHLLDYSQANQAKFFKDGKWNFPETILADLAEAQGLNPVFLQDAWGEPIRLVKLDQKWDHQTGMSQFDFHQLVSNGPDRKKGNADDVTQLPVGRWHLIDWGWWLGNETRLALAQQNFDLGRRGGRLDWLRRDLRREMLFEAARDGRPVPDAAFVPLARAVLEDRAMNTKAGEGGAAPGKDPGGSGPPMRVREYFPETMLWRPALITDDRGVAHLPLNFADSITTWRLSASASSKGGLLGGTTAALRVFQDFFVDLDLPVSLTQNDEVAFPVAVYNYLKTPQTVRLELEAASWFELLDEAGYQRSLDLKPNEVTSVKFRIKARRAGSQPLTVKARGTQLSDAIKRFIEVVPDGKKIETVVTDRLTGNVTQTITIPDNAVPDSYKLLVKIYPGVFSQVLEGTEGMLRLPGG